jgi:S-adenosylmethionine-diacylgycerolhomoserine-N-methlytransferase
MPALRADLATLWRMLRGQPRIGTHAERLDAFYRPQARDYDRFRERLLQGRAELISLLAPPPGAHVVELGGGTGRNLEYFGERLGSFSAVELVDLCPALLEQAAQRCRRWPNVRTYCADATTWRPRQPVDCVYLSYALTMIPDWQAALDNVLAMLKPGGTLGVVDFYVADHVPLPGLAHHDALTRWWWPRWFAHDGVHLNPQHLPWLFAHTTALHLRESRAGLPYLPGLRVPYYVYVGRKPAVAKNIPANGQSLVA